MKNFMHHQKSSRAPLGIVILIVGVLSMVVVIGICSFTLRFGSMSFLKDANADTEYVTVEKYEIDSPLVHDHAPNPESIDFIDPAAGSSGDLYINVSRYSTLEFGDSSSSVSALHLRLMELGYMDYDEVSPVYNQSTENAVKLFQRSNNLTQTGVATAELQELLFDNGAQEYRAKVSDDGIDVRDVQERLYELGYYNDKISGYYGPQTEMAVRLFQSRNEFAIDGEISRDVYNMLYSDDAMAVESDLTNFARIPADKSAHVENKGTIETVDSIIVSAATKSPKPTKTPTPKPTAAVKVYTRPTSSQLRHAQSGYVSSGDVNMRSGPGTNYSIVKKNISKNTFVTLYELQNGWWFLKCDSSYGYIYKNLIKTGTPPATAIPKLTAAPTAKPVATSAVKSTKTPTPESTKTPTPTAKATPSVLVYTEPTITHLEQSKSGYISSDNVNMRSGPGTSYSIISKDNSKYTIVTLYELQGEWWFVSCRSNYGYIHKNLIKIGVPPAAVTPKSTKAPTPKPTTTPTPKPTKTPVSNSKTEVYTKPTSSHLEHAKSGYLLSDNVNMRSGPGTNYSLIKKDISKYTTVTLYEAQGEWWFLKCGSSYGYIHKSLIKIGAPPATATPKPTKAPTLKPTATPTPKSEKSYGSGISGMIACAEAQIGDPYVKGAKGPDSFDCSGFVYYCMKSAGLSVSRTSAKNYAARSSWKKIEKISDLKKGDLIFWRSDSSSTVSHVGICTGGGGFIHASSAKGEVCRSSFGGSSSYWVRNFVCGRRPFS